MWYPCILRLWNCCSDARRRFVVALALAAAGWAECAGWQASPEARMACCSGSGDCPMHGSTEPGASSERVVTQAQADSCCAASDTDDSTPSAGAFSLSLSAALVPSTLSTLAPITAPPAFRRVAHARASPNRPGFEARSPLRLPDLSRDSTRVSRRHVGGLALVARADVCARSVVHDQPSHRTLAAESVHRHRPIHRARRMGLVGGKGHAD